MHDEIEIVSDVTVAPSDLTVVVPGPHGEKQHLTFDETCTSDLVAESVRKAIDIPSEDSDWPGFQRCVEETIEIIREHGPEGTGKIPLPTGLLKHLGFPAEIQPEIRITGGEKITYRKYTKTTIQKQEKPDGSS